MSSAWRKAWGSTWGGSWGALPLPTTTSGSAGLGFMSPENVYIPRFETAEPVRETGQDGYGYCVGVARLRLRSGAWSAWGEAVGYAAGGAPRLDDSYYHAKAAWYGLIGAMDDTILLGKRSRGAQISAFVADYLRHSDGDTDSIEAVTDTYAILEDAIA